MRAFLVGAVAVLCLSSYGSHSAIIRGNQDASLRMKREPEATVYAVQPVPVQYASSKTNGWDILSELINCVNEQLVKLEEAFGDLKQIFPVENNPFATNVYTGSRGAGYTGIGLKGRANGEGGGETFESNANGDINAPVTGLVTIANSPVANQLAAGALDHLTVKLLSGHSGRAHGHGQSKADKEKTEKDIKQMITAAFGVEKFIAQNDNQENAQKGVKNLNHQVIFNPNIFSQNIKERQGIAGIGAATQGSTNAINVGGTQSQNNQPRAESFSSLLEAFKGQQQSNMQVAGHDAINNQFENARAALIEKVLNNNLNGNKDNLKNFLNNNKNNAVIKGPLLSALSEHVNKGNFNSGNDQFFSILHNAQINQENQDKEAEKVSEQDLIEALAVLAAIQEQEGGVIEEEVKPAKFTNQDAEEAEKKAEYATAIAELLYKVGNGNEDPRGRAGGENGDHLLEGRAHGHGQSKADKEKTEKDIKQMITAAFGVEKFMAQNDDQKNTQKGVKNLNHQIIFNPNIFSQNIKERQGIAGIGAATQDSTNGINVGGTQSQNNQPRAESFSSLLEAFKGQQQSNMQHAGNDAINNQFENARAALIEKVLNNNLNGNKDNLKNFLNNNKNNAVIKGPLLSALSEHVNKGNFDSGKDQFLSILHNAQINQDNQEKEAEKVSEQDLIEALAVLAAFQEKEGGVIEEEVKPAKFTNQDAEEAEKKAEYATAIAELLYKVGNGNEDPRGRASSVNRAPHVNQQGSQYVNTPMYGGYEVPTYNYPSVYPGYAAYPQVQYAPQPQYPQPVYY